MNLEDARDSYKDNARNASAITRSLGLGGIAVVWLLGGGLNADSGRIRLSDRLLITGLAYVIALLLDLLQYALAALIWGAFARHKEKLLLEVMNVTAAESADFLAPPAINLPALACFWLKLAVLATGYVLLAIDVVSRLRN